MIKVLLTGANGQVGHEIKRSAPAAIQLISLDKKALDITSLETIQEAFSTYQPNYVINAAAYTAVDQAEQEPELAYAINATAVSQLAEECHKARIPLLHLSTDYVFDGNANRPYAETDIPSPLGIYGKSKWEGEEAIRNILPEHIILRTSWVFGREGNNFVKTILRLAKGQTSLRIVADQYGLPTSASDIAHMIWQIISKENTPWGTYHFANSSITSWHNFAHKIIELAKLRIEIKAIETSDYPTLAKRPSYSVLNCKKISQIFDMTPRHWEEALAEVIFALN